MTRKIPSTIRIKKETVKKLQKMGKFGESYDDIINKILNRYRPIKHEKWRDEDLKTVGKVIKKRKIIVGTKKA
ncbi:unnamed protein product [marine sediment metagenome]|uniref:Uncharacterized protein n=1 Tax=marine sediment metagenome TaxID=412755 RepID=X1EVE3_9ZZZZ